MQGLDQIVKQNNIAATQAIAAHKGKYLVAEYAGLHAVNYTGFDTEDEANAAVAQIEAKGPGITAKLFINK